MKDRMKERGKAGHAGEFDGDVSEKHNERYPPL